VWAPRHTKEISEAVAERLAQIVPRDAADEAAQLAPFIDSNVAQRISTMIDQGLREPGAREVTEAYRQGPRLVEWNACAFLLPTVIHCDSPEHGLANKEFMFPFASVVKVDQKQLATALGPSLVVTAITEDPRLIKALVDSPHVDRLNVGPVPTMRISWDQPHEGNLFDHLYGRRAFQLAVAV
jgi:hypothetical protein